MNDRDHFAAAALTGLLASDQYDRLVTAADYAETAYELADAMLRERERTNHDAAPEATAGTPGTGDTPEPINDCVSDRSKPIAVEPVAWGVMIEGGTVFSVWLDEEEAKRERRRLKKLYEGTRHGRIVVAPLYRQPTLSDAEREAVERGYCSLMGVEDMSAECTRWDAEAAAVLRGLLERTGGEKC